MKTVVIIQARYNSSRLPRKVLMDMAGTPVLKRVVCAASKIIGIDDVVVATSDHDDDTPIADFCQENGYNCFRGAKEDVLDRVVKAAAEYNADAIIRITADCPFLDPQVASTVLSIFKSNSCDYVTNTEPPTWPDGLDTEVVSFKALEALNSQDISQEAREHVTLHIRHNKHGYKCLNYRSHDPHLKKHRWTLDNQADFEFLQTVACKTSDTPSYLEILDVLNKHPEIGQLQSTTKRNEALTEAESDTGNLTRFYVNSEHLLKRAEKTIPLGSQTFSKSKTQYPVGHAPLFLTHGHEGRVWDVDGNEYVDMVAGLLPVVLGYNDPDIEKAVLAQIDNGVTLSLSSTLEMQLAEKMVKHIPCAEKVRFGKNGTDATSAAVRLSRAKTGRDNIVVCGYHGWQDWYIGSTTRHLGVPETIRKQTLKVNFNDLQSVEDCFKEHGDTIACLIMEPASVDLPTPEFLQGVRKLCDQYGIVLVFDEVITGFRFDLGGAQKYFGVTPDLACFGKAMGNGMPISSIVGRADIMDLMNDIFYSGTFAGETLSLAASLAVVEKMEQCPVIEHLWSYGAKITKATNNRIQEHGLENVFNLKGADPWKIMIVKDHDKANAQAIKTRFLIDMMSHGVLTLGSHNIMYAHNDHDLQIVDRAYDYSLGKIAEQLQNNTLLDKLETEPLIPVFQVRKAS